MVTLEELQEELGTLEQEMRELRQKAAQLKTIVRTKEATIGNSDSGEPPKNTTLTVAGNLHLDGELVVEYIDNLVTQLSVALAALLSVDEPFLKEVRGNKGVRGLPGDPGPDGIAGKDAKNGTNGKRGKQGPSGPPGLDGSIVLINKRQGYVLGYYPCNSR